MFFNSVSGQSKTLRSVTFLLSLFLTCTRLFGDSKKWQTTEETEMIETRWLQINTGSTNQNLKDLPDSDENLEVNALEVGSIWWFNHVQLCLELAWTSGQWKISFQLPTFRHLMPINMSQVILSCVQKPLYQLQTPHKSYATCTSDI